MFESSYRQLFQLDREETRGDYLLMKMVELVMVWQTLLFVWEWAAYLPLLSEVVQPLGFANYVDVTFLFQQPFAYANAFLITAFALAGFSGKMRYSYLIALLLFHFQYAARFSQGAIGHGSNMAGMVMLFFAVTAVLYEDNRLRRKVSFGLIVFFVGIGYISAALSKLIGGGLFWFDGVHLYLWMGERSVDMLSQKGVFEFNLLQDYLFSSYWLATLLLLFGLVVEAAGFLLWFRKTRWVEVTLLIGMHIGISVVMNLGFESFIVLLLAIGYPWNEWADRWLQKYPGSRAHRMLDLLRS